jgi:hypothetical protein
MQKAGLIPTIITLAFLCYFSIFSSLCLIETGKLINGIKVNNYKRFDYLHLIDSLITDQIFANSSKFCVVINHLLYSILCIITLSKVFTIFFINKFEVFQFIFDIMNDNKIQQIDKSKILDPQNKAIFTDENMIVLLLIFLCFVLIFFLIKNKILKRIFNLSIFILAGSLLIFVVCKSHYGGNKLMNKVDMFGQEYTYVSNVFIKSSSMELFFFLFHLYQLFQTG